jgi:ABC-type uncharacterized transport system permease subunit
MPEAPTAGQLALLGVSVALFAAAMMLSVLRVWRNDSTRLRIASKACAYWAVVAGVGVLVWHSITRKSWLPLEDNFDTLIWLGLLLALFLLYVQRTRPLGGLDWFILPIVILLLACAAVFGQTKPHEYARATWTRVHYLASYGGALAFAVAGAVGAMYLIVSRRLRAKTPGTGPNMGSLERLEHFTFIAVTLGFALFTVGLVTGFVEMRHKQTTPIKLLLASSVWLVYAVVLHAPINPAIRGRKTAVLSVIGFLLMVGTIVAVEL